MEKRVVIVPTYNEAEKIRAFLERVREAVPNADILVVDGNSPDGTGTLVSEYAKTHPQVSLLPQKEKNGLGKAYLQAFEQVLKNPDITALAMIDADFSHDPKCLPAMFAALSDCDVVIGSRYVTGGGIVGWELWRRLLSYCGNLYCKLILRMPLFDATSGFYCLRTDALRRIPLSTIGASGYAFQIEFKYLLYRSGARLAEFPIVFGTRAGGESKMTSHIIREGILAPWKMLCKK